MIWLWYREAAPLPDPLRSEPKRYRASGQGGVAVLARSLICRQASYGAGGLPPPP